MISSILNIFFTLFGGIYFTLYYFFGYQTKFYDFFVQYSYGKEIYSNLNGIIAFLLIVGVVGILTKIFEKIFSKFFPRNMFLGFLLKIIDLTKYFLGLNAFIYFSIIPSSFSNILQKIYSIGIIIILLISITSIINKIFKYKILKNPKLKLQQEAKTLLPFIEKVIIVIMWVMGIITIFSSLGYNVNAFIAGAGIGGLAIAFAAQKSISNIFGALTILLNKPFKVGDSIKINNLTGMVKDIGLTYVELVERNGHKVMIPNDATITSSIENLSTRKNRRTEFVLGVEYSTTSLKLQKGISAVEGILQKYVDEKMVDSYVVNFENFGQFTLDIRVLYYSLIKDATEYAKQRQQINFEIKSAFEKLRIGIAFPTQEVIIKK